MSKRKEIEVTHVKFSKFSAVLHDVFGGRTGKHGLDETMTTRGKNNYILYQTEIIKQEDILTGVHLLPVLNLSPLLVTRQQH